MFKSLGARSLLVFTLVCNLAVPPAVASIDANETKPPEKETAPALTDPIDPRLNDVIAPAVNAYGSAITEGATVDPTDPTLQENISQLQSEILGKTSSSPLDTFQILPQAARSFSHTENIDLSALTILDDQDHELTNARSNQFFNGRVHGFKIAFQGHVLNEFFIPIKSIGFFGKRLVFVQENTNHISFIDFDFSAVCLSRTAMPIFRLPVDTGTALGAVQRNTDESVSVNGVTPSADVFDFYGEVQEEAFNITAEFASPKEIEQTQLLADHFVDYFHKALELRGDQLQAEVSNLAGSANVVSHFVQTVQPRQSVEAFEKAGLLDQTAISIATNFKAQRKLLARMNHLWAHMSLPRPLAAPEIATALALVASGLSTSGSGAVASGASFREGVLQLINHRGVRMGAALAMGSALGLIYPHQVGEFFFEGLDISKTVMELTFGKIRDIGILAGHAAQNTLVGFNPVVFKNAYLTKESLGKLKWGLGAVVTTLYVTLGMPHLIVNTTKLVKEMRATDFDQYGAKEKGWVSGFANFLISRENRAEKAYLTSLEFHSGSEARTPAADAPTAYTADDDVTAQTLVNELRETYRGPISGSISSMLEKIKQSTRSQKLESKSSNQIESFRGALTHFLFSAASFTNSVRAYSQFWCQWMRLRFMVWTPIQFAMILLYPNMYELASKGNFPSDLNGGNRFVGATAYNKLFNRDYIQQVEAFEDKIIEVEGTMRSFAFKQTFKVLVHYMDHSDELKALFREGGVKSLSDKRLDALASNQQRFFRSYFNLLIERATISYLKDLAQSSGVILSDEAEIASFRERAISLTDEIKLSPENAERYVNQEVTPSLYNEAVARSKDVITPTAVAESLKGKLMMTVNPANNSAVRRNAVVQRQLRNPQAVARAVRSTIAATIVDKPLELLFTFVCLAGVTQGPYKPLWDDMFGPNSWFYLSRMAFTAGFVYDVITGVLADTWLKLQQDELHEGHFNDVPEGDDANGSYLKWYFKKTFRNPDNTLWQNHKHFVKIIWGNMKPAFSMTFLVGLLTLGRLDVDSYLTGYIISYLVPLSSFYWKLEQGFELSASYFYKDVPDRLRSHPTVQKFVNEEVAKRRLWFNFYEKFYKNILGFMTSNFSQMTTVEFGSRSFSRILFGGFTPTEIVVSALEKTRALTSSIPGAGLAVGFCERLIATGYTAFQKIPRPSSVKVK